MKRLATRLLSQRRPFLSILFVLACWTVFWVNFLVSSSQHEVQLGTTSPRPYTQGAAFNNTSIARSTTDLAFRIPHADASASSAATRTSSKADHVDPTSVAAILPISNASLPHLQDRLVALLDVSPHLREVVLLCHRHNHQRVRKVLLDTLADDIMDSHIDISFSVWSDDLEEGPATLLAARSLGSQVGRLLLLGNAGLHAVDHAVRTMLFSPFSTPLPVGPRGFQNTDDGLQCIYANKDPKAAAFLVPPLSVSPLLVPPHDLPSDLVYGIWRALGEHISRARYEGVGGIAVDTSELGSAWCSVTSSGAVVVSDSGPGSPAGFNKDEDLSLDSRGDAHFVIVLLYRRDLFAFTSVVCCLHREGHQLHILVTAEGDHTAANKPIQSITLEPSCTVDAAFVSNTGGGDDPIMLRNWLIGLRLAEGIVISTPEAASLLDPAGDWMDWTFIQIPREDLSYCDWMGSLSLEAWRNWHKPRLDISVITNDRPESLARLLSSLSNASFFGDKVNLRINVEQTADAETLRIVDDYRWPHGATFIHRRVIHGGLLPAVVESWYPSSNDSYGLMLEDDVELSPLFYAWIKLSLLHYRYGKSEGLSPQLFGISLYQQKNLELRPEGRHQFSARMLFSSASFPNPNTPYLSQIPCSWGAVYFPEHWREFHAYLSVRLSETHPDLPIDRIVAPGLRSNKWTRSWKKYFIELVYLRGYVMLYPNFRDYVSLSTNHLEVGSHVREMSADAYERKKRLYLLPLMERPASPYLALPAASAGPDENFAPIVPGATDLVDLPEGRMPPWERLPVLDLLGLLTTEQVLQERGARRREELFHCGQTGRPLDVRALLCFRHDVETDDVD